MACASCAVGKDGKPGGCNGNCSGGCNRMNTYDWLAQLDISDTEDYDLVEVTFNNGARKDFYHNPPFSNAITGDWVLVEIPGGGGYDVGKISLMGDLVKLQLKKKGYKDSVVFLNVIRRANQRDVEKLQEARQFEKETMVRARVISRTLGLDMKLGDVEYQGDGRKATFFYTADGRVDFRELIRLYAKEFKVKIEMRQIGARQESSRVGGIGSCGRELCCSTWLSDFKSVSTAAARYQQLAINQAKLSGMCGRLKCCLNYELDSYLDALEDFPSHPERLQTRSGRFELIKTDVFRGLMIYVAIEGVERGKFYTLGVAEVKQVLAMNKKGAMPEDLKDLQVQPNAGKPTKGGSHHEGEEDDDDDEDVDYVSDDLVGAIELPDDKRKKKKKKRNGDGGRDFGKGNASNDNRNRDFGANRGSNNNDRGGRDDRKELKRDFDRPARPPREPNLEGQSEVNKEVNKEVKREFKRDDRRDNRPDNRPPRPPKTAENVGDTPNDAPREGADGENGNEKGNRNSWWKNKKKK
jgi:cell fate regulator YaaT (PSP1 superfamily)